MTILQRLKCLLDRALHLGGFGCTDTEQLLFEYVEGELPDDTRRKLDKHLADCPACVRYVASYKKTIELTHKHGSTEIKMPRELQSRLREFIQQHPELR